jgi:ABC-2 type transport system ATP-binding protein
MIAIRGLTKRFGAFTAVDNVTFSVEKGEVLGFLGPNGAGKSTTMKMVTGFLTPTAGEVHVAGKSVADGPDRRQGAPRLPARGRPGLPRHDAGRLPALRGRHPRLRRR